MTAYELRIEPLSRALYDGVCPDEGAPRRPVDLAILAYFEDERPLRGLAALVDWRCGGALSKLLRSEFCGGHLREAVLLPGRHDLPTARIVLFGLGRRGELGLAAAREAARGAVAVALRLHPRDVLFALPGGGEDRELSEALLAGIVTGLGGEMPSAAATAGDDDGDDDRTADGAGRMRPVSFGAPTPAVVRPDADDDAADAGAAEPAPADPDDAPCRWWVVADGRHSGRLRRLLDGPPRAAEP